MADKFIDTSSDGKVFGKTEALAALKGSKYNTAEYTDVKVSALVVLVHERMPALVG